MNGQRFARAILAASLFSICLAQALRAEAREDALDRAKHLLLDQRVVETTENAALATGPVTKHPNNPLFDTGELPWETATTHMYADVIYDEEEELYKCWYFANTDLPLISDEEAGFKAWKKHLAVGPDAPPGAEIGRGRKVLLYAYSEDGIEWTKPKLGMYTYKGEKTNIVLVGQTGAGVMRDPNAKDPQKRFKLFGAARKYRPVVAFSPDGVRWSEHHVMPKWDAMMDSHNLAIWVPQLDKYVAFLRKWTKQKGKKVRGVGRSTSEDFMDWSAPEVVLTGDNYYYQIYNMSVMPYEGLYIGLSSMLSPNVWGSRMPMELTWSVDDTRTWRRIEPHDRPRRSNARNNRFADWYQVVPLGEKRGSYDYGCVFAAQAPIVMPDGSIRIYYSGQKKGHHFQQGALCLATMKKDHWAGYVPLDESKPGVVETELLRVTDRKLWVTATVEDGGRITVTAVDEAGKELASAELREDAAETTVLDLADTDRVRLRFRIDKAQVFSFGFAE